MKVILSFIVLIALASCGQSKKTYTWPAFTCKEITPSASAGMYVNSDKTYSDIVDTLWQIEEFNVDDSITLCWFDSTENGNTFRFLKKGHTEYRMYSTMHLAMCGNGLMMLTDTANKWSVDLTQQTLKLRIKGVICCNEAEFEYITTYDIRKTKRNELKLVRKELHYKEYLDFYDLRKREKKLKKKDQ